MAESSQPTTKENSGNQHHPGPEQMVVGRHDLGDLLLTVLAHAVLHQWTSEHTLAAGPIGAWVAFALFRIWRDRIKNYQDADTAPPNPADRRQLLGWRVLALLVLAVLVALILGADNLTVPTAALGAWVALELTQRRNRIDPVAPHPADPSRDHPTRRN